MAGYSKRTLLQKLGLKAHCRAAFVDPPEHYLALLGELPEGVRLVDVATTDDQAGELDFIHLFARRQAVLQAALPTIVARLARDGMLWISWPKKSSPLAADLDGNVVRELGLAAGLVDVKVAAVDQDWSGLKFVYRLSDR